MTQPHIAIQVGAISFLDEGVAEALDIFKRLAHVNVVWLAAHTFDRGTGGRQLEGHPLPDHGVQEYDREFRGGNFATTHAQFYEGTPLRDFQAPPSDTGGADILELVLPEAQRRDMQVFCWINENPYAPIARYVPNWPKALEVDCWGKGAATPCFNNPDYLNWHLSLVEDYCKSYPISGIAWASERQGPLGNLLGGGWHSRDITCWCPFCLEAGERRGINVERARAGYQELCRFFETAEKGEKPTDGWFVGFWRLLLNWPEILAWEKLWCDSQHRAMGRIYGAVKAIDGRPTRPQSGGLACGWHIMHLNSFSPFYRAEQDYSTLRRFSDFLKVVAYNNCAGARFVRFLQALHGAILRDADVKDSYRLMCSILGYDEAPIEEVGTAGFSADYVKRETARAVAGVQGAIPIYPGIDIDIPTGADEKKTQPIVVKAAVKAAFAGGAQGVILSRKYSEMQLANLRGAGEALEELGLA